jgi:hypothetical protein
VNILSPPSTTILTNLQQAANYVAETVQGTGAAASKEANKEVAKDSNATLNTRANAAVDALGDKKDEHVHNTKADVHKGKPNPNQTPMGLDQNTSNANHRGHEALSVEHKVNSWVNWRLARSIYTAALLASPLTLDVR